MKKFVLILSLLACSLLARAGELPELALEVRDGKFNPENLQAPNGVKFKLNVTNTGKTAEEFESKELNREKVVPPGKTITLFLGPLETGEYTFFGEFHPDTARGKIIVK